MHVYALVASALFTICESMPTDSERDSRTSQSFSPNFSKYFPKSSEPENEVSLYKNKFLEGDTNLEELPESKLRQDHNPQMKNRQKRHVTPNTDAWWKEPEIEYEISSTDFNTEERATIAAAFKHIEGRTCLKFEPRKPHSSKPYVYVRADKRRPGCYSGIGLESKSGKQYVNLGLGCVYRGVAVHEIMHRLGFYHEQSRTDRDTFVTIHTENIKSGLVNQFSAHESNDLGQPYDYNSIMHYDARAFTKNRQPTIVPNDPTVFLGQRMGLSNIDTKKINILFNCNTGGSRYREALTKALRELGKELKRTNKKLPSMSNMPVYSCPDNLVSETKCQAWQGQGFCSSSQIAIACHRACGDSDSCFIWASSGYCDDPRRKQRMRRICYCACLKRGRMTRSG